MKKFRYLIITSILILLLLGMMIFTNAVEKSNDIDIFPSNYQGYLKELKVKYPNWSFSALYTNLDWNYVIDQENVFGKNLVPKNYSDNWKNTKPGEYNVEVDAGWVDSSRNAVEYCMDPRNFLNEVRIFQFETLSYDVNMSQIEGIEKILYGTEFYKQKVSYLDTAGNNYNMKETYGDLILKAGKASRSKPISFSFTY